MKFKHKKILRLAKGYRGRGKNCYRTAVARVQRAWRHEYVSRRLLKRDMRRNWQQQINAGSRHLGVSYSRLVHCLPLSGIMLDRKLLAELARTEPYSFKAVVETVKATGLQTWQEKQDELLAANHERTMRYRQVQLGKAKPEYAFATEEQRQRLEQIAEAQQARTQRMHDENAASEKAAVLEVLQSPAIGEPWLAEFEAFEAEQAATERPLTAEEIAARKSQQEEADERA
jgi:large subunit ribosomal protein L20